METLAKEATHGAHILDFRCDRVCVGGMPPQLLLSQAGVQYLHATARGPYCGANT
jgi:hypothetical protein